ncbi:hypothetical protein D9M70_470060 [compost metagenome]
MDSGTTAWALILVTLENLQFDVAFLGAIEHQFLASAIKKLRAAVRHGAVGNQDLAQ